MDENWCLHTQRSRVVIAMVAAWQEETEAPGY